MAKRTWGQRQPQRATQRSVGDETRRAACRARWPCSGMGSRATGGLVPLPRASIHCRRRPRPWRFPSRRPPAESWTPRQRQQALGEGEARFLSVETPKSSRKALKQQIHPETQKEARAPQRRRSTPSRRRSPRVRSLPSLVLPRDPPLPLPLPLPPLGDVPSSSAWRLWARPNSLIMAWSAFVTSLLSPWEQKEGREEEKESVSVSVSHQCHCHCPTTTTSLLCCCC